MGIQNWSENILLVDLPQELQQIADELESVIRTTRDKVDCDIVIDFYNVDIITSSNLSSLLKLRKICADSGRRVVLSSVPSSIKNVFKITGIDEIFEFSDEKFFALASLQLVNASDENN